MPPKSARIDITSRMFGYPASVTMCILCILHQTVQDDIPASIPVVLHKAVAKVSEDRKPIGEVGCCESWMAERTHWWIERWLECRAIYLSIYLKSICLYLSVCLSIYPSIYLSICKYIYIYISIFLFVYLSISIRLSVYLSIHLSIWNEAILRDFLKKWKFTAPRRWNLRDFLNFWNSERQILRGFRQKWKVKSRTDGFIPMRLCV